MKNKAKKVVNGYWEKRKFIPTVMAGVAYGSKTASKLLGSCPVELYNIDLDCKKGELFSGSGYCWVPSKENQ